LLDRERVRVHHGAAELLGRVVLLDAEALGPGDEGLAQLRLEAPAVAAAGDHFVVRRYSPAYAIGGGLILDPTPRRHRRREAEAVERLRRLESGSQVDRARDWLRARGPRACAAADLAAGLQVDAEEGEELLEALAEAGQVVETAPGRYLEAAQADGLQAAVRAALGAFHAEAPLREAMPLNRLQAALGSPAPEVLQWALAELRRSGQVVAETEGLRLAEHRVALSEAQEKALAELEARARAAGASPLARTEALALLQKAGEPLPLLQTTLTRGTLVAVGEFVMHREALAAAGRQLAEHYRAQGAFGVGDVRDLWGTSRKTVVPILEHLDGTGFTRREGDRRHVTRVPGAREGVVD
jgi:selenocysteine-specific elongation factor